MGHTVSLLSALLCSLSIYGQDTNTEAKISIQDSILLNEFWTEFKTAVSTNNKVKLSALCKFPFYCRPCIDDTTLKDNNHISIKVTKAIFNDDQYKLFFDKPIKALVDKYKEANTFIFHPYGGYNKKKIIGFSFLYTTVAPSKKWEGRQGLISLQKMGGKYRIIGIDTVP